MPERELTAMNYQHLYDVIMVLKGEGFTKGEDALGSKVLL